MVSRQVSITEQVSALMPRFTNKHSTPREVSIMPTVQMRTLRLGKAGRPPQTAQPAAPGAGAEPATRRMLREASLE